MTPRVLIVEDGLGPHPLAATRSFGAAGWHVGIGSPTPGGRAGSSRWAAAWHHVPPAEEDWEAFLAATREAVAEGGYDLVFGADDVEVLALSAGRDTLGALFPYAAHDSVLRAVDKLTLTRAAEAAGLAVPRTTDPAQGPTDLPLPVVVKARVHWTPGQRGVPARLDRSFCATADEVDRAVARIAAAGGAAVVQEVVQGDLMAVTLLLDRSGRRLAVVQQRARRISPYWHNSVLAETVPVDPALAAACEQVLHDLDWWGLANLQFLAPPDGGAPRLIDFNGRFYGSLALAGAAGCDLPVLWARAALDPSTSPGEPLTGTPGVRYQSLEEDLRRAVVERRGGLVRDVTDTLRTARGAVHSTWSADDPRPALRRSRQLLRAETRELARRCARAVLRRRERAAG
ncbi:ATP-grasp domain-containing protein [Geodermatophilus poikilotrophus]|jgi:predicted ATP-grasp superfamily ATP-dependent carboligase|uniref:Predicted ATP-dependent carboligase, ATP-grasp superfamily n=1 Tax=Geodermatophilus poikilotrophus TaxID=1333667 RepID=A0A1I0FAA0_9ACTN|nr:ATP-grasp domain-containing protein [Geodermatophilus poikilotrophus]SET55051.1 Predicted ATP-dependent carboligase, ATP-grasp superfamily [Geodermatophilus poikilotrophus]